MATYQTHMARTDKESGLDIFLRVPGGMVLTHQYVQEFRGRRRSELVLKLKKTLHGLKQYGRCITDMCLYYKGKGDTIIVLGVYVDDLLVRSANAYLIQDFFKSLSSLFIKQLGPDR